MSLIDLLASSIDETTLPDLCMGVDGISPDDLKGHTTAAHLQHLVCHAIQTHQYRALLRHIRDIRPHLPIYEPNLPPADTLPEPGYLPPDSRLPYGRNDFFTGRQPELHQLAGALLHAPTGKNTVITATGPGGMGKTQLAVEFAHRFGRFFPGGVFWLSFAQPESIPSEIAACGGTHLSQGYDALKLADQVNLVQQWWQEPVARLFIFDNCEDETLLRQYGPGVNSHSRLLLTSRRGMWSATAGVAALPLRELTRPQSKELLRRFAPRLEEAVADAIAHEVGDLPLALHLAGSFIKRYGHATYLEQLQDKHLLDHPAMQGHKAEPSQTNHELHVGRTFALSYDKLNPAEATDQAAIALLGRAAYFAPGEPIDRQLLLATWAAAEELVGEDALLRLVELGLVEQDEQTAAIRLHRLVAAFGQRAVPEGALAEVEQTALEHVRRLNQAGYPAPIRAIEPHVRHITDRAKGREDERAAGLCNNLGYYLQMSGQLEAARPYYERALHIHEQVLGATHPDTATSLGNLGYLLQTGGQLGEARPYYERALRIHEQVLGATHSVTATSLNNLGYLLLAMGQLGEARPYCELALHIREQVLGATHPDTASSLGNLGYLLQAMGQLEAACPYYERALDIYEQTLGPTHPDTALSLNNLGGLLRAMGQLEAARPYYERALGIREQTLGPTHPDTAQSLNNLGYLLQAMGQLEAARPCFERALGIWEQTLGPTHPDTALCLNNLGGLLQAMGQLEAARPYYERALGIFEQTLRPTHPDTARSLNNLAILCYYEGKLKESAELMRRAVTIFTAVLGPAHPDTQQSARSLAAIEAQLNQL